MPLSYVETIVEPEEQIARRAHLHWMIYWPAIALVLIGLLMREAGVGVSLLVFLAAAVYFVRAAIRQSTTEIAVTNQRVIQKHGLISRNTIEINIPKIESVDVHQSVPGRLLDYGTVIVRGTGGGLSPLSYVSAPLQLRRAVQLAGRSPSPNTSMA